MSGQFSNVKFFLYIYSHTRVLYVIINSLEIQRFYSIYQETLSLNLMRWWDNMPMTHWIIQFNLIGVNSCVCMCVCVQNSRNVIIRTLEFNNRNYCGVWKKMPWEGGMKRAWTSTCEKERRTENREGEHNKWTGDIEREKHKKE